MRNNSLLIPLVLTSFAMLLSGCHLIYKPDIKQGNTLSEQKVKAIHGGMTKEEVIATLGAPILTNVFEKDQMVYVYTIQPGHGKFQTQQLRIYFINGRVAQWTSSPRPTAPSPAAPV